MISRTRDHNLGSSVPSRDQVSGTWLSSVIRRLVYGFSPYLYLYHTAGILGFIEPSGRSTRRCETMVCRTTLFTMPPLEREGVTGHDMVQSLSWDFPHLTPTF